MHFRHIRQRSITLQEVARAAGVSSSAASVILNGAKSGTRVSSATQRSVLEVAKRLGYRQQAEALSRATGSSGRIGVYSGQNRLDSRNSFFAEVLGGVFDGAQDLGLDTVVHTSGVEEARLIDLVKSRSLDGLIIHPIAGDPIVPLLSKLLVPAVAIADSLETLPSVVVDDVGGGTLLAQHLASLGHRHVLVKQSNISRLSAIARVAAFSQTCTRLGVKVTARFEIIDGSGGVNAADLRLLTEGPDRATAVMAWSDSVAESVCLGLDEVGIAVPGSVSVVGFDGIGHHFSPRYDLTTICAPWAAVGREAVRQLSSMILGGPVSMRTTLPVSFHHGNTT